MREGAIRRVASLLRLGTGGRSREWVAYPCPFARWKHPKGTDSKPSFGIRINTRGSSHYYCFTCHASGQLSYLPIDLASHSGNHKGSVDRMLEILAIDSEEGFGSFDEARIQEEPVEPLGREYEDIFDPATDHDVAMDYLRSRGVKDWVVEYMGIGYDPEDWRVVFPVRDYEGLLYGYTGRTILLEEDWPRSVRYGKSKDYLGLPKKHMLLNVDKVEPGQGIVTVEGPIDTAVAMGALTEDFCPVGILGSKVTEPQLETLIDIGQPVYLFLDNDKAGDHGIYGDAKHPGALAKLKGEVPVFVPGYPDRRGASDVGSLTPKEIRRAVRHARAE